jgi:hypothetical protein
MKVILTVGKCPTKKGYSIFHNQHVGWQGTLSNWMGWYKYKKDAITARDSLQKSFDTKTT